ncbi:hypothetical protein CVT24_009570 [Panaeolus cyanescens]|uniref:Sterol regulatory element-binding protein cleavage-activating protein n=1 Tax=Panaeolus cyanescens TaxID=181874 RepID=A0A409YAA0_9AGAR|nr:hypothetical protein CVT24_009570 [Panaeolus cyanescens]
MVLTPARLLHSTKSLGHSFFLQFGLHCATHQIRVILISCIVITSLFYPALDAYTSSRTSSQTVLDSLLSNDAPAVVATNDLADIWSQHDTLRTHNDPVTRAKCQEGRALRIERIFIQSPQLEDDSDTPLDNQILLSTLDLEHRLQSLAATADSPCLKLPNGQCIIISPLAFWNYDKDLMRSDKTILDTLSYSQNISIAGIPITSEMVLAGRGSFEHHPSGNDYDYATFLALSLFFPNSACWSSPSEQAQWTDTVRNAVGHDATVTPQTPEATLIGLEYDPNRSAAKKGWSAISALIYVAYIAFFAYVGWSVKHMDAVHSRLGVTFTALVEIAVSTITSLSVCALVGFKITMVPWELLPIVIVFVGAENMFNLVDAVGKTSVTLPVKQRIAEGLSRAGTSNTLKVVAYNGILGVISVFTAGAVRQFCIFAIVVLVAHWFLAHTFFMAVLSIDIARLELEELLRYDSSIGHSIPQPKRESQNSKQPRSAWQKLLASIQSMVKGRAATNISLLMLLGIAATLYYTTYTSSSSIEHRVKGAKPPLTIFSRPKTSRPTDIQATSAAELVWKTLNPETHNRHASPLLHVRLEQPVILTFNSPEAGNSSSPTTSPSRYTRKTFNFAIWLLTVMFLPIVATTSALWVLLLYLLKNTELLEAQRHRFESDPATATSSFFEKRVDDGEQDLRHDVAFHTLPRAFGSDVELTASSRDGRVTASVSLRNEIFVWKNVDNVPSSDVNNTTDAKPRRLIERQCIDASEVLLGMAGSSCAGVASTTISCLAVDDGGSYVAVGTAAGSIAVWVLKKAFNGGIQIQKQPVLTLDGSLAAVTEICFVAPLGALKRRTPPARGPPSSENSPDNDYPTTDNMLLLATYDNGIAVRWTLAAFPAASFIFPSKRTNVIQAKFVHLVPDSKVLIAFAHEDGTLELVETGDFEPTMLDDCIVQPGDTSNAVTRVHACRAQIGGSRRLIIGAATQNGVVSLWDGLTGECIALLEDVGAHVDQLRVTSVRCETCRFCGQRPMESVCVAASTDRIVTFHKVFLVDHMRRCSCSSTITHQTTPIRVSSRDNLSSLDRRSRSNSNSSQSLKSSPLIPRARLSTSFEASTSTSISPISAFPVSGHGVHSRRASEKEARKSSELLTVPFPGNLNGEDEYNGGSGATTPTNANTSIWRNAVVHRVRDIPCERGGWDLTSDLRFSGITRKPRTHMKTQLNGVKALDLLPSSAPSGLSNATLERWEVWTFDASTSIMKHSLLSSLAPTLSSRYSSPMSSPRSSISSSSGDSIPRLPFTRVHYHVAPQGSPRAIAGFGNTIGVLDLS